MKELDEGKLISGVLFSKICKLSDQSHIDSIMKDETISNVIDSLVEYHDSIDDEEYVKKIVEMFYKSIK